MALQTFIPMPQKPSPLDALEWKGAPEAPWLAWVKAVGASDSLAQKPKRR